LSAPPDPALVEGIAADLGVDPAFVEKDSHMIYYLALKMGKIHGIPMISD
jgi:hypothetical protein